MALQTQKPVIGLCPDYARTTAGLSYCDKKLRQFTTALEKAGAHVIVANYESSPESIIEQIDGWLIPGGRDIHPRTYGQETHPMTKISEDFEERHAFDAKMWELAHPSLPIMGVCYGSQFINVMSGGTLVQHIDCHHKHNAKANQIRTKEGSKLREISKGIALEGHCYHHQGMGKIGQGLRVAAVDNEGMVHALESTDPVRWLFALLWHPERSPEDFNHEIFKGFVEAACRFKEMRQKKEVALGSA